MNTLCANMVRSILVAECLQDASHFILHFAEYVLRLYHVAVDRQAI